MTAAAENFIREKRQRRNGGRKMEGRDGYLTTTTIEKEPKLHRHGC